CQQRSSYPFTF
nr:immunoglobulin light chain junction region [Mus musculus]NSL99748.1 immunoglobulin light chain junction region [Mus musculus]NSL99862.1 immunoglobulin light chain junction region [Mus musculus]NSM01629.1 immunoglobulin light chain junction region [Mus musculus]